MRERWSKRVWSLGCVTTATARIARNTVRAAGTARVPTRCTALGHSAPGSDTAFSAEKRRLHYQPVADTKLGDDARWMRRVDLEFFSQAGDACTQF